ncbi:MAG: acylase [Planctomycetaceae bacterium]|nr:acylase [Planctomycetaceae bacterium]
MRDGVRLSAYLFFPPGKGPWPVLMEQRYASFRSTGARKRYARLAAGGYVAAAVNFRGTQASEGKYVGYRALQWGEKRDGYDTVQWLAKQPWSTGKIGTVGGSQGGYAQNYLAVTQPPNLACQFMRDTGLSLFHEGYRIGGTTRPNRFHSMAAQCRVADHNRLMLEEWFRHPNYDEYWRDEDATLHFDKMNVPCLTLGSWYDFMNIGSIESFIGRQHSGGKNSRGKQKLVIGPWLHGGSKSNVVGELTYPENAAFDINTETLRWADYWLKGKQNGVLDLPNVRYYVMGAVGEKNAPGNKWRTADDFPIPAVERSYYLHPDAVLKTEPANASQAATKFLADPFHPATVPNTSFPGARDARPFEKQAEVRTFTTDVLTKPTEWTGKVKAEMFFSSTARDTDLIVRVSDVYPDGRSILIIDFIRRVRYREGFDKQVLLTPGKVVKVAFDVGWMSQIFNKGHRIRITVASTAAPYYEPNPNTGEALTIKFPNNAVVATNRVHHDRKFRSRVIAPIPKTSE